MENITNFIDKLSNSTINKIRLSLSDAEVRRLLKEEVYLIQEKEVTDKLISNMANFINTPSFSKLLKSIRTFKR